MTLDRLWRDGPFRGASAELVAAANAAPAADAVALRAFAVLACLRDENRARLDELRPPLAAADAPAPVLALTAAGVAWRTAGEPDPLPRARALAILTCALDAAPEDAPAARSATAWGRVCLAESALILESRPLAARNLRQVAADGRAPCAASVHARVRLAQLDAFAAPRAACRRLDSAARAALAAGAAEEAGHALCLAAILTVGTLASRDRFEQVLALDLPAAAQHQRALAALFLAMSGGEPDDEAFERLGLAIRLTAEAGDLIGYSAAIGLSARAYEHAGRSADAVATLENGIACLDEGPGHWAAAGLVAERGALEQRLGRAGFAVARAAADRQRVADRALLAR